MKNLLKEFKDFIARGNLVELAVALVLALAFKSVIDAFMNNVVNPLIGAIVGKPNLDNFLTITVREGNLEPGDHLDRRRADAGDLPDHRGHRAVLRRQGVQQVAQSQRRAGRRPTEVDLLTEIRDALRARN